MDKKRWAFEGTEILMAYDEANNRVHMLDLDKGKSLTNALDAYFCRRVLKALGILEGNLSTFKFICYHTDSEMTQFHPDSGRFEFVGLNDERMDREFVKEMFYLYGPSSRMK